MLSAAVLAHEEGATARARLLLVFGLLDADRGAVARAVHMAGAALPVDAPSDGPDFGVSTGIAAAVAATEAARADGGGPLDELVAGAEAAIRRAVPTNGSQPTVLVASAMDTRPFFWIARLESAGYDVTPLLVVRNPLAAAQALRGSAPPQRTLARWRRLALAVLGARPGGTRVLSAPEVDWASLDLPDVAAPPVALATLPFDRASLAEATIVSAQVRALHRLLERWPDLDTAERTDALTEFRTRAKAAPTPAPLAARPRARSAIAARTPHARPPLLLHYHIFKNAGTSVDKILQANFADRWVEREFEGVATRRNQAAREYLLAHPELDAFSSHTAPLPVPDLEGRPVVPILFVRHPLLRIRSAYLFERRQQADTRGSRLAKAHDLAGYVKQLLDSPRARHARNFQTQRLAAGTPGRPAQELARALHTVATFPFVGLVEAFAASVDRLAAVVRPSHPAFEPVAVHANATAISTPSTVDESLVELAAELGHELYAVLERENADDLALYDQVRATYRTSD